MDLKKLDYELPDRLIAQYPATVRDHAKLMFYDRGTKKVHHTHFSMLPRHLNSGDLLVMNESRVIKSRVFFKRKAGGKMEIFFLSEVGDGAHRGGAKRWECLFRPSRKVKLGDPVEITRGLMVRPVEMLGGGRWIVECECEDTIYEKLERVGQLPLPPYIRRGEGDNSFPDDERYQTVYAQVPGSVAAPTAGLHFTEELLAKIKKRGVRVAKVNLNIGYGTFSPIRDEKIEDHRIHSEYFSISPEAAALIGDQKKRGRKILAIGTSVVRTLETAFGEDGIPQILEGFSDLFIFPGYRFKLIDGMITNFHLPRSSLIALVMAFCGIDELKECYRVAVSENYRFFSYGDAMLIL